MPREGCTEKVTWMAGDFGRVLVGSTALIHQSCLFLFPKGEQSIPGANRARKGSRAFGTSYTLEITFMYIIYILIYMHIHIYLSMYVCMCTSIYLVTVNTPISSGSTVLLNPQNCLDKCHLLNINQLTDRATISYLSVSQLVTYILFSLKIFQKQTGC